MKPSNSRTQGQPNPRKNRLKVAYLGHFFPQQLFSVWWDWFIYRKQTGRNPTQPHSPPNTVVLLSVVTRAKVNHQILLTFSQPNATKKKTKDENGLTASIRNEADIRVPKYAQKGILGIIRWCETRTSMSLAEAQKRREKKTKQQQKNSSRYEQFHAVVPKNVNAVRKG